ncbi:MAG: FdhF/YdeP family oxidoreductase [Deltaproteobacteria bacterium]|nr:FdhF/YdeP family oxidoreductase [Deltaproteobacteria bacterium]
MRRPPDTELPRAQPPEAPEPVSVSKVPTVAGGIPAIASSMKFALAAPGPVRGARLLLKMNQHDGFDCPGCAWPDPDGKRSMAEFCENGAKALAEEATAHTIGAAFFAAHSVKDLAEQSDHWLGQQGRLVEPLVLRPGATHYAPISWDEAFALVARELNALGSPDEAAFYTSGRTSNEAAFLYQLFVRQFGTNNLPDCSNMCHESSGTALSETLGIGKGTVKLDDFPKAQVIVVIGQNPGTNHPRMLTALQDAARAGAKLVSINPLPEAGLNRFKHPQEVLKLLGPGTALAHHWLQVRVNGDVPLLQLLGKMLLEANAIDRAFVDARTDGFEAYRANVMSRVDAELEELSGITRAELQPVAELLRTSERIIFCWAMGLTQHANAVGNIQEIVNLLLLRGSVGKPGAGACPVRGHSNVQGDRTMGIWERPKPEFLDALARVFQFEPPRKHGHDTVDTIRAMRDGNLKVFFALGGNFLSATPDTELTATALRRCTLTAHVSTKLNRAHLVHGETALILPCRGRTEIDVQQGGPQFVSVENSMGVVHASRGAVPPASEALKSEVDIVASLAQVTLGSRSRVDWRALTHDYDRIRDLIEQVIPGFERYNARVRQAGGFYLPNAAREGVFKTDIGKARFTVHPLPALKLEPGQLLMMTVRSHDQYNTTIYGLDDRYRGIRHGRRVVFLNAADIDALGLHAGQVVDLTSHFQGEARVAKRFVVVPYNIPKRCAATYFPEANVLVPLDHTAARSNTPASKSVVISVAPSVGEQPSGLLQSREP